MVIQLCDVGFVARNGSAPDAEDLKELVVEALGFALLVRCVRHSLAKAADRARTSFHDRRTDYATAVLGQLLSISVVRDTASGTGFYFFSGEGGGGGGGAEEADLCGEVAAAPAPEADVLPPAGDAGHCRFR